MPRLGTTIRVTTARPAGEAEGLRGGLGAGVAGIGVGLGVGVAVARGVAVTTGLELPGAVSLGRGRGEISVPAATMTPRTARAATSASVTSLAGDARTTRFCRTR